jgi:phosphoglucosamine mutase
MVEAGDLETAQGVAERLAQVVRTELALALVSE